jgi:hypothetical protein
MTPVLGIARHRDIVEEDFYPVPAFDQSTRQCDRLEKLLSHYMAVIYIFIL